MRSAGQRMGSTATRAHNTHTHARTQHSDTQTPRHPDTQTPRHPDTQTPRHPDTQTPRHPDTQTPTQRRADTETDTDTQTRRHAHAATASGEQPLCRSDTVRDVQRTLRVYSEGEGVREAREVRLWLQPSDTRRHHCVSIVDQRRATDAARCHNTTLRWPGTCLQHYVLPAGARERGREGEVASGHSTACKATLARRGRGRHAAQKHNIAATHNRHMHMQSGDRRERGSSAGFAHTAAALEGAKPRRAVETRRCGHGHSDSGGITDLDNILRSSGSCSGGAQRTPRRRGR
jgi:hypothetical protein